MSCVDKWHHTKCVGNLGVIIFSNYSLLTVPKNQYKFPFLSIQKTKSSISADLNLFSRWLHWWLERWGCGIHIMWIPFHVGVMGNEQADSLACEAVQGDTEFAAHVRPSDFRPLSRVRMLDSWQCSWSEGRMGGYTYLILPAVSLLPCFRRFDSNWCVVTSMNRMMPNHSCLRSHLKRINIGENLLCVCLGDYETIDHVLWIAGIEGHSASVARSWNVATWKYRTLTSIGWFKTKSDPK
jgi:hypothetical protein